MLPIQTPIQRLQLFLFSGLKRPGCEVGHSTLSSSETKNECSCTFTALVWFYDAEVEHYIFVLH